MLRQCLDRKYMIYIKMIKKVIYIIKYDASEMFKKMLNERMTMRSLYEENIDLSGQPKYV
jgi:hypothetical protein